MFNKEIMLDLLNEYADLLEFNQENVFKINAFRNGANILRKVDDLELLELIREQNLSSLKGIGEGIKKIVNEYYDFGFSSEIDNLKASIPSTLPQLFKIRGLGPKKINFLYKSLNISNIDELEEYCLQDRISGQKGFGEKLQAKILEEIERIRHDSKFILLNEAIVNSESFSKILADIIFISKYEITGSVRRRCEVHSEIEFVVLVSIPDNIKSFPEIIQNSFQIPGSSIVKVVFNQIIVLLHVVNTEKEYDEKLFLTTGSREFVEKLIGGENFNFVSEKEIFGSKNIEIVIPEMRESIFFEASTNLQKASTLSIGEFKGFFHFHTTYSDGQNSLLEMAEAAKKIGYNYFAVCDHSKTAIYANGLSSERLLQQYNEINDLVLSNNIVYLQGIESDILTDGSLDYDDEILKEFKLIVASVHSRFSMKKEEMTSRVIKAIENPFTDVLGHPTGRLLLNRPPYEIEMEKVIDACAQNDVAIEINAHPVRLDLDWRLIYYAREKGCKFSINSDAHSIEEVANINYGIMVARKGGLNAEDIINCFDFEQFKLFANRKVKRFSK